MLLGLGMMYGVVMVNVPYQDPTPAQAASEQYHTAIWLRGTGVGACVIALSILALCAQTVIYLFRAFCVIPYRLFFRHPRAGGDPRLGLAGCMDSRLRGNDGN